MPRRIRELIPPNMKSPKCYGTKLRQYFDEQIGQRGYEAVKKAIRELEEKLPGPYTNAATRLGIEVEVENIRLDRANGVPLPWIVKGDGSLRNNGAEFISAPILPQDVSLSIASLYGFMKAAGMKPDFSWRTSTHVHMEANQLSVREFKNFLLLYLIFEDSLFQFARPGRRETNIFCTPLSRTDYRILRSILRAEDDASFVNTMVDLPRRILKYSALNLSHIFGYGTVEFRHLGGEKSPEKVCIWLQLLLRLFEAASRLTREDIERNVFELNTNSFYRHFLNEVFGDLSGHLETNRRDLFLSNGVVVCKEILAADNPVSNLQEGEKNGLHIFSEAEAKKHGTDPLEEKRKSVEANNQEEFMEVQDEPVPAEDERLYQVMPDGTRSYEATVPGLRAATRWWNPHGHTEDAWLHWKFQLPGWRGFEEERRIFARNSNPRYAFNPI